MSTMSLDVTTVRSRRVLRWAAVIGGAATAVVIGLLTAESFFYTATDAKADANASLIFSQPVAATRPVTFEIVPSPVIDANAEFFFGTGDNSEGFYSHRPTH